MVTQGQSAKKSHRYRIVNLLTQQERVAEIETPSLAVLKSAIALVLQSQSTPYMLLTREGDVATDASLSHSELLYVLHYTGENGMVVSSSCGSHFAESCLASHTPLPSSSDLTQVVHAALSTSYCISLPSSIISRLRRQVVLSRVPSRQRVAAEYEGGGVLDDGDRDNGEVRPLRVRYVPTHQQARFSQ